jgi:hypothetical protein
MADLIAQTAADLALLVATATTDADAEAVAEARDLLAALKAEQVVTYGKIGSKVCENPLRDMDEWERRDQTACYMSRQTVSVDGIEVGVIERLYTQKRREGYQFPIVLGAVAFVAHDDAVLGHVCPEILTVYAGNARQVLAELKAEIAAAVAE